MKKFILSVILTLGIVLSIQAQSGYSTGRHYSSRGGTSKVFSNCYTNY
jgi:hypothetical protein